MTRIDINENNQSSNSASTQTHLLWEILSHEIRKYFKTILIYPK
jgi:hypothetical protein